MRSMRMCASELCCVVGAGQLGHRRRVILTGAYLRVLYAIALIVMAACAVEVTDDAAPQPASPVRQATSPQPGPATPEMPLSQLFVPVRDTIQDLEPLWAVP